MTDQPSNTPGLISIYSNATTKTITFPYRIPRQILRLRSYRVEFQNTGAGTESDPAVTAIQNALACKILYVNLGELLSFGSCINNDSNQTLLPLLVDSLDVTVRDGLDIPIYLSKQVPTQFTMNCYDSSIVAPTGFVDVTLIFELSHTVIS